MRYALVAFDYNITSAYVTTPAEDQLSYAGFVAFIKQRDFSSTFPCHKQKKINGNLSFANIYDDSFKSINSPKEERWKAEIMSRMPHDLKPALQMILHHPIDEFAKVASVIYTNHKSNPTMTMHTFNTAGRPNQKLNIRTERGVSYDKNQRWPKPTTHIPMLLPLQIRKER